MDSKALILGKDISWDIIDGQICRIIEFTPLGKVENGKVVNSSVKSPYAFLMVKCDKLPQNAILNVFHKTDFLNLASAFKQKKEKDEVLVIWTAKHYKNFLYKIFSTIMPKLIVWVCKKGAYALMTDKNYKPELTGEARFLAERPVTEWKSEVMD